MATPSLGDLFTLIDKVIVVVDACKNAQGEIDRAGLAAERLLLTLVLIEEELKDYEEFKKENKKLSNQIDKTLKEARDSLKSLEVLLQKWLDGNIAYRYTVFLISKMSDVGAHTDRIAGCVRFLNDDILPHFANKDTKKEIKKIQQQLAHDMQRSSKNDAQQLKIFMTLAKDVTDVSKIKLGSKDWQALVQKIAKETSTDPGTVEKALKSFKKDLEASKKAPSPSPAAGETLEPRLGQPRLKVLFLDLKNGSRSVMAMTYLHLLRIAVAKRTGQWMFAQAESGGAGFSTGVTTAAVANYPGKIDLINIEQYKKQLKASTHSPDHVRAATENFTVNGYVYPGAVLKSEKDNIAKVIVGTQIRGVWHSTLSGLDYIICLDKRAQSMCQGLVASGMKPANVQIINLDIPYFHLNYKETYKHLCSGLAPTLEQIWGPSVKTFIEKPVRNEVRQFIIPLDKAIVVKSETDAIKSSTKVRRMRVEVWGRSQGKLVTLVGEHPALEAAEKSIRAIVAGHP